MQRDYSEWAKKKELIKILFEEPISAEDMELTLEEEKFLLLRGIPFSKQEVEQLTEEEEKQLSLFRLPLSVKGSFDKQESNK